MKMVLTSHGSFCEGILDSYRMIAGDSKNIYTISLTDSGIKDYSERLNKLLADFKSEEILILTDIKGGTPYNEAYKYYLSNVEKVKVVSGMNLPMVIEAGLNLSVCTINDLFKLAIENGRDGIEGIIDSASNDNDLDF